MTIQLNPEQISENVEALISIGKAKKNIEAMIEHDYRLYMDGNADAGAAIVEFWNTADSNGVVATVRTQLRNASRSVHESLGVNVGIGATVKDGVIVLATTRQKKSKNPLLKVAEEQGKKLTPEQLQVLADMVTAAAAKL